MKVIFYGNRQGNLIDKTIRWWTSPVKHKFNGEWKDSYSHSEIEFSDGVMFSASQYENRTRFARRNPNSIAWVEVDIDIPYEDEKLVRMFCQHRDGLGYDYKGILGFVFGTPDNNSQWFCSEICTAALHHISIAEGIEPSKTSPNALYNKLTKGLI
jgi:ribosomal protein L24E